MTRAKLLAWLILLASCIELTVTAAFSPGALPLLGLLGISVGTYLLVSSYD